MKNASHNALDLGRSFLDGVHFCVQENNLHVALCLLHNSVKQACIALILIKGNSPVSTHSIRGLLKVIEEFAPEASRIFLDPETEFVLGALEKGTANHRHDLGCSLTKDLIMAVYGKAEAFVNEAHRVWVAYR